MLNLFKKLNKLNTTLNPIKFNIIVIFNNNN